MSVTRSRYQILFDGLVDCEQRKEDAFRHAERIGIGVEVFDLMARRGCVECWRLTADGWEVVSRKPELDDSESFDAADFDVGSSLRSCSRDWVLLTERRRRE